MLLTATHELHLPPDHRLQRELNAQRPWLMEGARCRIVETTENLMVVSFVGSGKLSDLVSPEFLWPLVVCSDCGRETVVPPGHGMKNTHCPRCKQLRKAKKAGASKLESQMAEFSERLVALESTPALRPELTAV